MALCTLALFVVSLGYGVVVPLLPQLASEGGDAAMLSVVYAVYAAAKIGAQLPAGLWVDRVGGKRVLLISLSLFTLSLLGFCAGGSLKFFAVVRAVEGAATGLAYPALFSLILQGASEETTGRKIGTAVGIGTSGLLVGPALGNLLSPFGLRVPVIVAAIVSVLMTIACFAVREGEKKRTREPARYAFDAAFFGIALPIAFNKLTYSSFQGLLPLHGPVLGMGTRGVTGLFILTGVCFAIAQPIGGILVDRFKARSVALVLTVPLLISLVAMTRFFVPGYTVYVLASSIIFTAVFKHAARAYGTDDTYGGIFGVLGTLTDLMTIVGPLLFLNLYAVVAGEVFLFMALCGLPFAIGFWVLA